MIEDTRKSNSKECEFNARKLSDVVTHIKTSDTDVEVCIGHPNDDQFYSHEGLETLEGRIRIELFNTLSGDSQEIDLEDTLVFAAKHCAEIYKRVYKEHIPKPICKGTLAVGKHLNKTGWSPEIFEELMGKTK